MGIGTKLGFGVAVGSIFGVWKGFGVGEAVKRGKGRDMGLNSLQKKDRTDKDINTKAIVKAINSPFIELS